LALFLGATVSAQTQADSDFKVTLLGIGTPIPDPDRFGPSTLVEAGSKKLPFDAGRGVPIRLRQIGLREGKIGNSKISRSYSGVEPWPDDRGGTPGALTASHAAGA